MVLIAKILVFLLIMANFNPGDDSGRKITGSSSWTQNKLAFQLALQKEQEIDSECVQDEVETRIINYTVTVLTLSFLQENEVYMVFHNTTQLDNPVQGSSDSPACSQRQNEQESYLKRKRSTSCSSSEEEANNTQTNVASCEYESLSHPSSESLQAADEHHISADELDDNDDNDDTASNTSSASSSSTDDVMQFKILSATKMDCCIQYFYVLVF